MKKWRIGLAAWLLCTAVAVLAWAPADRRLRAADMLVRMSKGDEAEPVSIATQDIVLDMEHGRTTRTRLYWRVDRPRGRGVVLAHGVHYQGIEERRLVAFARNLAEAGMVVSTPLLRDIADYRITALGVEEIQTAVLDLSSRSQRVKDPHVGLIGFSFAGGLSLVAASDESLAGRLAYVTSVGGHHRLDRVLRFFVTNRIDTPEGSAALNAHDYGLVVLVYGHVESFVPEEDRDAMTRALRAWLQEDRDSARTHAAGCRTDACRVLFDRVASDRLEVLAPQVLGMIDRNRAALDALSPAGHLGQIPVPVYLLHGTADTVIPATEVAWAEQELAGHRHRAMVTPLLDHVSVSKQASWWEKVQLVDFMSALL